MPTKLRFVPAFLAPFPNIKLRTFFISEFVKGSYVEDLWKSGQVHKSQFYHSHCSDMLR